MRRLILMVLLALVLAACSSGSAVDLSLTLRPGDQLVYLQESSFGAAVASPRRTISGGTLPVSFIVTAENETNADVEFRTTFNGVERKLPLLVDLRTGEASLQRSANPGLAEGQLDLFHDRFALTLGTRPRGSPSGLDPGGQGP